MLASIGVLPGPTKAGGGQVAVLVAGFRRQLARFTSHS